MAAVTWTDNGGHLWLFGGQGFDSTDFRGLLNDLWEFDPATSEWAWMSGSETGSQIGVYGTLGAPAAGNVPGARYGAVSWTDSSGHLWLFGGYGLDVYGQMNGALSDLWEFDPATSEWTWMGGSDRVNQGAVYGTLGMAAAGNTPGGRYGTASWIDSSGHLWLFGGNNYYGDSNDLWEFDPGTDLWTWMGGGTGGEQGVYGTLGTPAAGNIPGARENAISWTDNSGHFWLFGGAGLDSTGVDGNLNDLWQFDPVTSEWTWMGGSGTLGAQGGQSGVYGTLGAPSAGNTPGGRYGAAGWTDGSTHLWLFGGFGIGSSNIAVGSLNDLWRFDPSTSEWTWMGGSSTIPIIYGVAEGQPGVYGTLGIAAAGNIPGARYWAASWTDSSGNLWSFGGWGFDSAGNRGYLNDLWEFTPPPSTSAPAAATPTFSPSVGTYTSAQTVTISDSTTGATIYYTTNGTTPTTSSTKYTGPINVGSTETIEAIATASGYSTSAVASATYTITPATAPTVNLSASPSTGVIAGQTVTLTATESPTLGVAQGYSWTIYDGTTALVSGAISNIGGGGFIMTTQPLSAGQHSFSAVYSTSKSGYASGTSNTVNINVALAPPIFSLAAGTYTSAQTVTLSDTTAGTTIYYTTNGTAPTTSSTVYTGPITISSSETIEAIAAASGFTTSAVATVAYTITPPAAPPMFSPAAGTYTSPQTVTISDATSGATIYYTTNGTTPTTSSPTYTGPISVSSSETIEAIATASGYSTSTVATAAYTINLPAPGFTLTASPTSVSIAQSSTGTSTITITDMGGFTGTVTLAATGLPSGVSASFANGSTAGTQVLTLTANTSAATTSSAVRVTITGNSGSLSANTTVSLSVTAEPSFAPGSGGTTSMTVTPGATTGNTGTISVAGTNGFSGTVTLTCSVTTSLTGVSDMPTCSLNPTSVTVSGTRVQTSTLTVTTTAASNTANVKRNLFWPSAGGATLALSLLFVRPRWRSNWRALLGVFILFVSAGLVACGGSSSGNGTGGGSNPGTTAGAYTITVTGTSGSVSATVGAVALTVQ